MAWLNRHLEAIAIAIFLTLVFGTYMIIQHQQNHIYKLKRQLYYANLKVDTITKNKNLEIQALENQLIMLKEQVDIEKEVNNELDNSEEEFVILAAKRSKDENNISNRKCYFDGIGWVFK